MLKAVLNYFLDITVLRIFKLVFLECARERRGLWRRRAETVSDDERAVSWRRQRLLMIAFCQVISCSWWWCECVCEWLCGWLSDWVLTSSSSTSSSASCLPNSSSSFLLPSSTLRCTFACFLMTCWGCWVGLSQTAPIRDSREGRQRLRASPTTDTPGHWLN